jgi:hypothetical protein
MEAKVPLSHDDYTVGWIYALAVETAAAKLMLDEIHPLPPHLLTPLADGSKYLYSWKHRRA